VTGWEITIGAHTTAASTRVSEVRRQLGSHERVEHRSTPEGHEYRLVWVKALASDRQMALVGE
jgi:hypothetical protein